MFVKRILLASGLLLLAGCSKPDQAVEAASGNDQQPILAATHASTQASDSKPLGIKDYVRCSVAATYLEDSLLKDAINFKGAHDNMSAPAASQTMQLSEQYRNELEPDGSSTSPEYSLKKAATWRDSDSCQVFVQEYHAYLNQAVLTYGKSVIAAGDTPKACSQFQDQYGLAHLATPSDINAKLQTGVQATLRDAYTFIKPYQVSYFNQSHSGAFSLNEYCTAHPEATLKEAMQQATAVVAIKSPATEQLQNTIEQIDQDEKYFGCAGKQASRIEQKICINHLYKQAVQTAYETSTSCDREIDGAGCSNTPEQMIHQAMQPLVQAELDKLDAALTAIIADPMMDANADGEIRQLAEPCKQDLVRRGIEGDAYEQQTKAVCLKQAQAQYLSKYKQQLVEVKQTMKKYS